MSIEVLSTICCMPWHARGAEGEAVHGGSCRYCAREIAIPRSAKGKRVACIYCGIDRGFIPEEEIDPHWHANHSSSTGETP